MMYVDADNAFAAALEADPECALGYWGRAMTLIHPMWPDTPTSEQFAAGAALVADGLTQARMTPRERAYLNAVGAYYRDAALRSEDDRLSSFAQAWRSVYEIFPDDPEAAAFYALAYLAAADPTDKSRRVALEAGAIAEGILKEIPDHPGGHHYVIHAYDSPELAERAVEVARNYGKVAPDVPHALHMPSHIFTLLGYWDESIQWNRRAAAAAKRLGDSAGVVTMHYLHALDYLTYAYLQSGQDGKAAEIRDKVLALQAPFTTVNMDNLTYHITSVPARYALERYRWDDAVALGVQRPESFPWGERFHRYEANVYAARALGAARLGRLDQARDDLARSRELLDPDAETALVRYWARETQVLQQAAEAWIEFTEGNRDRGFSILRDAAQTEKSFGAGSPRELMPATEMLGAMHLAADEPEAALSAFEALLEMRPHRLNAYLGAGRAAETLGDGAAAAKYYRAAVDLVDANAGDTFRVDHAREFLNSTEPVEDKN
ncbi:MAG: hypothetical protein ACE5FO_01570 [Parvularculaceae bacterium]